MRNLETGSPPSLSLQPPPSLQLFIQGVWMVQTWYQYQSPPESCWVCSKCPEVYLFCPFYQLSNQTWLWLGILESKDSWSLGPETQWPIPTIIPKNTGEGATTWLARWSVDTGSCDSATVHTNLRATTAAIQTKLSFRPRLCSWDPDVENKMKWDCIKLLIRYIESSQNKESDSYFPHLGRKWDASCFIILLCKKKKNVNMFMGMELQFVLFKNV